MDYRRLLEQVQGMVLGLKERRATRKAFDTLSNFSNDDLKDIGLSRSDLLSLRTGAIFSDDTRRQR